MDKIGFVLAQTVGGGSTGEGMTKEGGIQTTGGVGGIQTTGGGIQTSSGGGIQTNSGSMDFTVDLTSLILGFVLCLVAFGLAYVSFYMVNNKAIKGKKQ